MPASWIAHYLDGRTATRHRITVTVTPQALHLLLDNGETKEWSYQHIRQTQGAYNSEHVRFEYGDEAIILPTSALLIAIHKIAPTMSPYFYNPSIRKTRLLWTLCAALGVLLLVAALYRWGIPSIAANATPYVPLAWEEQLGRQVIQHLAPETRQCHNVDRLRKLDHILEVLTATRSDSSYHFKLSVIDDLAINAFAAPGGQVVILRGLLEKTDNAEQLAGVLAHELQHIYQRHTIRAILEQTASTLLLATIIGDLSGGLAWELEGAQIVGSLHYSRIHETEADVAGLHMLLAARIDPAAMIAFYGTLPDDAEAHGGSADFLSTHPNMKERLATLMSLSDMPPANAVSLLPGEEWQDIRTLCRLEGDSRIMPVSLPSR
ncbi:MAG TPA: M48 family metallopeptidase [Nitrospira sp.]|jgi:predicted Zn-dependent protease|nr:M48 family metallopeptidase [Nitrospira sp.]